jgi:DNA-binding CsgD family transcriptional regulator
MIKDYQWMIGLIKEYQYELDVPAFKGVASYGIEASLPKGQGMVSKALELEVERLDGRYKRISDYINKVNYINDNRHKVTDEKEIEVLDCLLDGDSLAAIGRHMGISKRRMDKLRSDIVDRLCE